MRLTTIWTLRGMSLRERLNRTGDLAVLEVARRLPKRLAYWSYIVQTTKHIMPHEIVPEMTATNILSRMSPNG